MLVIRAEQMQALSKVQAKAFEDRMVAHIQEFFPDHHAAMKEDGARELIHLGIERAARYGIIAERDVCMYIEMMIAFGPDYDESARLSWAGRMLRNPTYTNPSEKMEAVHRTGLEYLRQPAGKR